MSTQKHKKPPKEKEQGSTPKVQATAPLEPPTGRGPIISDLLNDPRPKVQLPGNDRLLSDFATELAQYLQDKGVYQRGGIAVIVNQKQDGLDFITSQLLRTLSEKHVICYSESISERGKILNFNRTMTDSDARGVLEAKQFIDRLPKLDKIATARLPVMRNSGKIELLGPGYDAESATLTVPACDFDDHLQLKQAKQVIDDLLTEFSFAKDEGRSKAVAIAAMVGQFANGLIPQGTPRPVFSYLANAEGAGKTLCAKCAILPAHGIVKVDGDLKEGEEVSKLLLTAVMEGRDYILFDNCKGYLNSPALESFVSSAHYSGRILGISKSFSGENNTAVFITGNGCTFSPDLRRRSLVVQLFMAEEFAEDRKFSRTLDDAVLLEFRPSILAALWTFVREWDQAKRPKPSREHGSFPRWAEVIGGIVEFAGYSCPLERAQIEGMVDTDGNDMRQLVEALTQESELEFEFNDLVAKCQELGLFERIVNDVDFQGILKPGAKSTFGHILKRYDRRCFGRERPLYFIISGKGHGRRFQVVSQLIKTALDTFGGEIRAGL